MPSSSASALARTLVFVLCVNQFESKAIHSFAGPYIAFGHRVASCPSMGWQTLYWRLSHFNPAKPFELQRVSGNITSMFDVEDGILTKVDMSIWANNQWKENAFIFKFPNQGCSAMREQFPNLFRMIAKRHNDSRRIHMDKKKPCVIPKGYAVFDNDPLEMTFPNFPVIPYGRYRFRVTAVHPHDKEAPLPSFCLEADCEVIPKPI